jgi:hypothetical protein
MKSKIVTLAILLSTIAPTAFAGRPSKDDGGPNQTEAIYHCRAESLDRAHRTRVRSVELWAQVLEDGLVDINSPVGVAFLGRRGKLLKYLPTSETFNTWSPDYLPIEAFSDDSNVEIIGAMTVQTPCNQEEGSGEIRSYDESFESLKLTQCIHVVSPE